VLDEPVALEGAQHARQVARVEAEPRAQVARRRPAQADLVQRAQLPERAPPQVATVERADLAGDQPVEGADEGDVGFL
jgi:hypothetical protein